MVIRRLVRALHRYLKRNKAEVSNKIYLWEFVLMLINTSGTSQMYLKIQRHTLLLEAEVHHPDC